MARQAAILAIGLEQPIKDRRERPFLPGPAWTALEAHHRTVAGLAMGALFEADPGRFKRFSLALGDMVVDYSKNRVTAETMDLLMALAREADVTRVKRLEDVKALAAELNGFQVNIDMRAGSGGRLYGSVTNVMIAEALAELTDREIDRRIIEIEEPIRRMGNFEVNVRLDAEVEAKINVLVYPTGTDPLAQDEDAETAHGDAAEADDPPVAEAKPAGPEAKDDDESGSDGEADAEADEA